MVWGDKFLFDKFVGKQTRYRLEDKAGMELARARGMPRDMLAMMPPGAMHRRALAPTAYPFSPMMAGRFQPICVCGAMPKPWHHLAECPVERHRCGGHHGGHRGRHHEVRRGGRRRRSRHRIEVPRLRGQRRWYEYDDDSEYGDGDSEPAYSDENGFEGINILSDDDGGGSYTRYRPGYYQDMEPRHQRHAGMHYREDYPRETRGGHGMARFGGDPYAAHEYRDDVSGYGPSNASTW